jgi:phosphoglycerate dehydrogenase-like enzyme
MTDKTTATTDCEDRYVLVLREGAPAFPAADFRAALEHHLPDRTIRIARTPDEERELLPGASIVAGNELSKERLELAKNLRLYAHASSGIGTLPLDELVRRGVAVTNGAGLMPSISEQVLGYLLTFARDLREGMRRQERREWRHYQPGELTGSTVTVVGLGSIGTQILNRLEPFYVERLGVRHTPEKGGPADEVFGYNGLHEVFSRSDCVILSCPLTEETRGLVGRSELRTLPNDAVLVNVARGPVVDTDELVGALRRNVIGGAALDVTDPEPLPTEHPLWEFDNVLLTPHNAGSSPGVCDRVAALLAENLARVDECGEYTGLKNQVIEP